MEMMIGSLGIMCASPYVLATISCCITATAPYDLCCCRLYAVVTLSVYVQCTVQYRIDTSVRVPLDGVEGGSGGA
jgi:hypothetical protein